MAHTLSRRDTGALVLRLEPAIQLSDEQFFQLCQLNDELRIERTAEGELEIMSPAGWSSSNQNARLTTQLTLWAEQDGTGEVTDSSGGFTLPNGATRAPDAAWVLKSRLAGLTPEQRDRFLPLCPDFVAELRSPSDSLDDLQEKLEEYIRNGVRLGWLLDPRERRVYVYRPGREVETLEAPATVAGDPELPGLSLDLDRVWGR